MNNKKIDINEFVKKFNLNQTTIEYKTQLARSIITTKYVPILDKKIYLQVMLDNSINEYNGKKYIDMFVNKINFTTAVLSMYTCLDISNKGDKDAAFKNYDLLAKHDLINVIFNEIPESEMSTLLSINEQLIDTFNNKNNSIESYLDGLVKNFSVMFGTITDGSLKVLINLLSDEKKLDSLMNKLSKIDKSNIIHLIEKVLK